MPAGKNNKTKRPPKIVSPGTADTPAAPPTPGRVPIVGIGASAGGLEAFEAFFRACPVDSGIAFVLVPHLDPGHESLLTEILQRCTSMPVAQATDQVRVAANQVYVIPPNREMAVFNGCLQLSVPEQARGQRMPIDGFLRSLAEDQGEHAIGIILSGTATDGTLGLRAILGAGGVCLVQDPATAKYDGMPQSAIAAGYATHILAVEQMPAVLQEITRRSAMRLPPTAITPDKNLGSMNQILLQVRKDTGHDFSLYKKSTIGRRIERRMAQNNIDDLAVYARHLKTNPAEVNALFKEMLINVTSFFRDPEAFVALKQTILPPLLADKPAGYVFRVWVAGCASGEEAYSIAMILRELLDQRREVEPEAGHEIGLQIYATDLDDDAIATARAGVYPPNIVQDVTPERLRRFFVKDEAGYKVKKELRETVVFAIQNVIKDPPFTKLDLLSCRNLMIYLEPALQDRLIPSFHYALKPNGILLLSTSESIASHPELFSALDRKWKIYQAKPTRLGAAPGPVMKSGPPGKDIAASPDAPPINKPKTNSVAELTHRALLSSYAPASVTTDADGTVLYVHGDTGHYLRPAPGPASSNIVDMARDGLALELHAALLGAATQGKPTLNRDVSVKTNGGYSSVRFSVRRLPGHATGAGENLLLISFEELAAAPPLTPPRRGKGAATLTPTPAETEHAAQLKRELALAKESLQAIIEELQATNEELKSTNEELQSTNEELQSSNEELETSKEEMQSLNEEMATINAEQNARIEQMSDLQNDMKNLLDSTNIGTLFLDHQLHIRRFTREAAKAYRLVATDLGRALSDIKSNIDGVDLHADLQAVLDTLIPREREVHFVDGAVYLARMQPYRTLNNVIEGVVLTFTDITESRQAARLKLDAVQLARELAEGIVNTVSEPLIVLDSDLQVVSASRSFYRQFGGRATDTAGRKIYDLGNGQWNIPALRQLLENILPQNQVMDGYVLEHRFPGLGPRRMVLNARRIVTAGGSTELILLAMVALETLAAS